jgi:predicted sulfurtransferase
MKSLGFEHICNLRLGIIVYSGEIKKKGGG